MKLSLRVHHLSFPVADLERSRSFYEGILGLEPIPRPDAGALGGIWYGAGDCEVHLIVVPEGADVGAPPPALNPLARHAAFAVDDFAATLDHLESHGLEVLPLAGAGQMWVRDPDGHIIELIAPAG